MKIGIMQPYFLPYIGYWQLIQCVDKYVIYDDVNFIKGGWINRNRYLYQGEAKIFNIIMKEASSFKKINEVELMPSKEKYNPMEKLLSTFTMAYKKAPFYAEVYAVLEKIVHFETNNLSCFIENSIREICKYLQIETELILSSKIEKNNDLKKEARVIEICKHLGGDTYINAIGGKELYESQDFEKEGLKLNFLKTGDIIYKQFNNEFVPNLSIVDVMMFNNKEEIKKMLSDYSLEV